MNHNRIKELMPVLQAFADGKIIQSKADEDIDWYDYNGHDPVYIHRLWRIKPLEFPPLPEGLSAYHNPERFTPEQFGEGFRPLVEGELAPSSEVAQIWSNEKTWVQVHHMGMKSGGRTYRVPRDHPFPKKKVMVPLDYEDIQCGDIIRFSGHDALVTFKRNSDRSIALNGSLTCTTTLDLHMKGVMISKDRGLTFQPFEKEA